MISCSACIYIVVLQLNGVWWYREDVDAGVQSRCRDGHDTVD